MRLFLLYNMKMDLIRQLDASTLNFVEQIRSPFLTLFFKAVTFMGEWYFVLGVLVLISLFFIIKKTSRFRLATRRNLDVFFLWLITVGGFGAAFVLKEIFHRGRPVGGLIAETSSSFPSAHSVISIAFYAFVFYLLARNARNNFSKYLSISALFLFPLLLGFSRLYLGVHYLSDVLAGYAIGDVWFLIGVYGIKFINRKKISA